jgi:ABC-type nitrate/sulfonate/bicarbonate transport system substrate-binding protein
MRIPRSRRLLLTLLAAFIVASMSAAVGLSSSSDAQQAPRVVRVGVYREISEAFLWNIGKYLQKYNIKPEFIEAGAYPQQVLALQKGDTDFGIIGVPQIAALAAAHDKGVKVVAGYSLGGQEIVLRNDVKATNWNQLAGMTIGAPLSTATGIMVRIAMDRARAPSSVKVAQAGFTGTAELQALRSNQWQGLAYWPPTDAQAVVDGYASWVKPNTPLDINATPAGPANGLIGAGPNVRKDSALMTNFLKAFTESLVYTRSHRSEWIRLASQLTSVKPEVVKASLTQMKLDYGVDVRGIYFVGQYGPKLGFTKRKPTMNDIRAIVDVSYLAKATGKSQAQLTKRLRLH